MTSSEHQDGERLSFGHRLVTPASLLLPRDATASVLCGCALLLHASSAFGCTLRFYFTLHFAGLQVI